MLIRQRVRLWWFTTIYTNAGRTVHRFIKTFTEPPAGVSSSRWHRGKVRRSLWWKIDAASLKSATSCLPFPAWWDMTRHDVMFGDDGCRCLGAKDFDSLGMHPVLNLSTCSCMNPNLMETTFGVPQIVPRLIPCPHFFMCIEVARCVWED